MFRCAGLIVFLGWRFACAQDLACPQYPSAARAEQEARIASGRSPAAWTRSGRPRVAVSLDRNNVIDGILPAPADRSATIDSSGLLTPRGAGRITVRAEFNYPNAPQNQALLVFGSADLRILAPRD